MGRQCLNYTELCSETGSGQTGIETLLMKKLRADIFRTVTAVIFVEYFILASSIEGNKGLKYVTQSWTSISLAYFPLSEKIKDL
jgi:hypothetical protein